MNAEKRQQAIRRMKELSGILKEADLPAADSAVSDVHERSIRRTAAGHL